MSRLADHHFLGFLIGWQRKIRKRGEIQSNIQEITKMILDDNLFGNEGVGYGDEGTKVLMISTDLEIPIVWIS